MLKDVGADMLKVYDLTAQMSFVFAAEARWVHFSVGGYQGRACTVSEDGPCDALACEQP